jgi:cyclopropane-fatty-acyl-phospholipid synthase
MINWLFDRTLRRLIRRGSLTVVDPRGASRTYGTPDPAFPSLVMRLHDDKVARDIVTNPRLGAAEAFMDGRFTLDGGDIMDFVGLVRGNNRWESGRTLESLGPVRRTAKVAAGRLSQINWPGQSQRNVAHHYDLSAGLYELFLDRDRQYSCAYFASPDVTLEQAQRDKKAHIAAKLDLRPGQKVLDIGCGWGGMALYLHEVAGVDVLGITLSEEQLKIARERAAAAGVADHVRFELIDYRTLAGRFDRIVSVGMFEHVGVPHYREFFRICHDLLTDDGVMLLHTIGRIGGPGATDKFTRKYIFPGGYIPAMSEVLRGSEPNRLIVTDVEVLRLHYALTLRQWYDRTVANRDAIVALYDERFYRMWTFYLAGATAAFESGGMVNFQIQFARDRRTLPLTRDYMLEAEHHYQAKPASA